MADFFTRLRGGLDWTLDHDLGRTQLAISTDVTRYDTVDLEDDAKLSVAGSTTVALSDRLELRGTLSAALSDEGDDLFTGNDVLATRTRLAILAAGLQAGIRLDPSTTLVLDVTATTEEAGLTRFPGTAIRPIGFEADRRRLALSATAMRTEGLLSYGLHAGLHLVRAEAAALLPAVDLAQYTVKLQAALANEKGASMAFGAGIQVLEIDEPAFRQLRPTFEVAAALPFGDRVAILASALAGYDTVGRDDPVGAFVRKAEAALSIGAMERLRLVAGVYGERRDNIGLGGLDRVRAVFVQAQWKLGERWSAQVRVDTSHKHELSSGEVRRAVETQLSLTAAL